MQTVIVSNHNSVAHKLLATVNSYNFISFSDFISAYQSSTGENLLVVLEYDEAENNFAQAVRLCHANSIRLILIAPTLSEEPEHILLEYGVSRFLTYESLQEYLSLQKDAGLDRLGRDELRIVLYESVPEVRHSIQSIGDDYGVTVNLADNLDHFFSLVEHGCDIALTDIGAPLFDIPLFVKKALYIPGMLKTAFVPYAATGRIGISDIQCGLNRLARAVLTLQEVMGFLLHLVYRREVTHALHALKEGFQFDYYESLLEQSVSSIYHQGGVDLLSPKFPVTHEHATGLYQASSVLRAIASRLQPYLWLMDERENVATCGQGACI